MIAQSDNRAAVIKQLQKTFHRYPNVIQKIGIIHEEINISLMKNS